MAAKPTQDLHTVQVSERPPKLWTQTLNALVYIVVFNLGCLMVNATQFIFLLPLRLLPFAQARAAYDEGIRYTKGCFGTLLCEFISTVAREDR